MGVGCDPSKCKLKCTEKLSHHDRKLIFDQYYAEGCTEQSQVRIDHKNYKYHNG